MTLLNRIIFFTVIFTVFFGLQYLVYKTFRNYVGSIQKLKKYNKLISLYPFLAFNLPYIYIIANGFSSNNIPPWIYNYIFQPFYVFQSAVVFIGLFLLAGKILKSPFSLSLWVLNKFAATRNALNRFFSREPVRKIDYSRRTFIKTSTAFVSGYAFIGSTMGVLNKDEYEINYQNISVKDLPDELKGTTITLFSDIHSGPYMKENEMHEYADVINSLNSDLILIPGDLTNSNKNEIFPFSEAFKNLKAKNGIYASLGNHDYFSDPDFISKIVLSETPIRLLRNESEFININGKHICLIGVDDTRQSGSAADPVLMKNLQISVDKSKISASVNSIDYEKTPKISLFHKPYFFDTLKEMDLDLILSGHTHGGQVVLAKFGDVNISFAGAVSKYISGLYESSRCKMYVSRGIGSVALPIRFNCRPEITKITLV
ncbi:MAG: metallophosphoesterase [Ignavibacteria bacterium]|nr:metallophosphoesterase [Ignavibacteria bacterium]